MDIFREVNGWTADEFLSQFRLSTAADGKSYVCPVCNKGKHGDGIRPRLNSKRQVKWHCFGACARDYSNFDLAAAVLGYDSERELEEATRAIKDRLGYSDDKPAASKGLNLVKHGYNNVEARTAGDNNFSFSKGEESARSDKNAGSVSEVDEKNTASEKEPRNLAKLYKYCRENYSIEKFVDECGGKWRGLTAKTLTAAGCLYHAEYMVGEGEKAPVVIVPYDDELYFWREVNGKRRGVPKDVKRKVYVAAPIKTTAPNFMFESELDALSAAQVLGNLQIGCVATGSASFVQLTLEQLERQFGNAAQKPSFIVVFDNDESGVKQSREMVAALRSAGYPAESFFLEGNGKEPNLAGTVYYDSDGNERVFPKTDANDVLQRGGNELMYALLNCIDEYDAGLRQSSELMTAARERERLAETNKSGIKDFPLSEYFAGQFFSDVALTSRYSERRTGFANLDGTGDFERGGQKQIFMPGLYMLGGQPGTGKTSFAWQLVNQLADAGEFCVFCSYEMSRLELYSKMIARELFKQKRARRPVLALSSAEIRLGRGNDLQEVRAVVSTFAKSAATSLRVLELTNTPVTELFKHLEPLIADAGKPPVVVVDYLQIAPPVPNGVKVPTTKEKIDDILLRLKNFQRDNNATVIVVSAFNRQNGKDGEFEAFRESSSIDYSADVTWSLMTKGGKDGLKKNPRPIRLKCIKNRNGAVYDCFFNYYPAGEFFDACDESDLGGED